MFRQGLVSPLTTHKDPLERVGLSFNCPFANKVISKSLIILTGNKKYTLKYFVVDSHRVRFLRNSKCGSTSIVHALSEVYPVEAHPVWKSWDKSKKYLTFTVYRDQDERVYSAWKWMKRRCKYEEKTKEFETFKKFAEENPYLDLHWMPQDYLLKKSDVVLNYNDLEEEFKKLCQRCGLTRVKFPLPRFKNSKNW